jgi:hypothetical protein
MSEDDPLSNDEVWTVVRLLFWVLYFIFFTVSAVWFWRVLA